MDGKKGAHTLFGERKEPVEAGLDSWRPVACHYAEKFDKINQEASSKYQNYITKQILQQHANPDQVRELSPNEAYRQELLAKSKIFKLSNDGTGLISAVRSRSAVDLDRGDPNLTASVPSVSIKENRAAQQFFIKKIKNAEHRLPVKMMKLRYKSKLSELLVVKADQEEKGNGNSNLVAARVYCTELKKKTRIWAEGLQSKDASKEDLQLQTLPSGRSDAQRRPQGSAETSTGSQEHE